MNAIQMELLLKDIEDYHAHNPDIKGVSIVEGEISEMQSLLYTLKGRGVIGLFNDADIPMGKEKDAVEDRVYFFDVNWDAFKKFKKSFLGNKNKDLPLKYNPKTGRGTLRGENFTFRLNSRNHKIFSKLWLQIREPIKRADILRIAEYNGKNTEDVFIKDLVSDIRQATKLNKDELILNNDLTLEVPTQ